MILSEIFVRVRKSSHDGADGQVFAKRRQSRQNETGDRIVDVDDVHRERMIDTERGIAVVVASERDPNNRILFVVDVGVRGDDELRSDAVDVDDGEIVRSVQQATRVRLIRVRVDDR